MFRNTQIYEKTYEEALRNDEKTVFELQEFKKELEVTRQCLEENKKHLFQHAMIPLGNGKALIKGKLVHTNEIFAYIGDNWFVKTSADRAIEICNRRLERCDEYMKQLKMEMNRFDSNLEKSKEYEIYPDEDIQEIIEPFDEETEKEWKMLHKERVKECKERERAERYSKPDIFKRLDQLEREEANSSENRPINSDLENFSDKISDSDTPSEKTDFKSDTSSERIDSSNEASPITEINSKKRVSFSDLEEKNDCTLTDLESTNIIRFKHSANQFAHILKNDGSIESPSDIYQNFLQNSRLKSILKKGTSYVGGNDEYYTKLVPENRISDENHDAVVQSEDNPLKNIVGDISEKASNTSNVSKTTRRLSQFKKSRMKNIQRSNT